MKVLKFGGTSVANAENISKVINILKESAQEEKLVVVVSALGGTTDTLLEAGAQEAAHRLHAHREAGHVLDVVL